MSNNTDIKNKPKTQADKTRPNITDPKGIPEVFDSSKYDSMKEMKESADTNEERHLEKVLSSVEKEEPIKPDMVDTNNRRSNINTDSSSGTITDSDASPPNLEERAATLRGSKEEQT
jgi:hypothetical protein